VLLETLRQLFGVFTDKLINPFATVNHCLPSNPFVTVFAVLDASLRN